MKKKRIIPLVLFKDGHVVQSRKFNFHRPLGQLDGTLRRLDDWQSDEVIILDITSTRSDSKPHGRVDLSTKFSPVLLDALEQHSRLGSMPLTVGGGLTSIYQVEKLFAAGADKVFINSSFYDDPSFLDLVVREFGSQAVVFGVDYVENSDSRQVMIRNGSQKLDISVNRAIELATERNVGEIFLNSITRDGAKQGMDIRLLTSLKSFNLPLILCGGAGSTEHLGEALEGGVLDGVSAANFFQHVELSVIKARARLLELGHNVRKVDNLNFEGD